jgi:hypothetical protein
MITPLSFLYRLRRPSLLRPEPRCSVSAAPPTCGLVAAAVISLVGSACSDPPTSPVDADGLNGAIEAPDEVPAAAMTFCRAWKDPAFVANRPAAYYVRVMQQPTPRWSSYDCQVAPTTTACSDGSLPPTIRERAWTSPIFVSP